MQDERNKKVKFQIFKKKKSFYWTNTAIVYTISTMCLFILFFKHFVLKFKDIGIFDKAIFYMLIGSFAYGIIMVVSGFVRYQPLKGELKGVLILERDKITIEDRVFYLNEISQIKILNYDYHAKFSPPPKGSFEASLSRGVNNNFEIKLFSGERINCFFYQYNRYDMLSAKKHLFFYYLTQRILFF